MTVKKKANKNNKSNKSNKNNWWIFLIIAIVCICAIGGGLGALRKDNGQNDDSPSESSASTEKKNSFVPGEDFSFDKLTLNVSPKYNFEVIRNQFSDDDGKTVVVIPIKVTNNDERAKTLNMYSYKGYGAKGVELDKPSAYFMEEAVDFGGDLQPGASYTKNMYFLYDGNGNYKIEFGYYNTEASVSLDIKK